MMLLGTFPFDESSADENPFRRLMRQGRTRFQLFDAVNADAGITHIDKHLVRSRLLFTDSGSSVRKVFTSTIIQVLDGS